MRYILNVSQETEIVDSIGASITIVKLDLRVLANEETREIRAGYCSPKDGIFPT